jgi:hypothetical protein
LPPRWIPDDPESGDPPLDVSRFTLSIPFYFPVAESLFLFPEFIPQEFFGGPPPALSVLNQPKEFFTDRSGFLSSCG